MKQQTYEEFRVKYFHLLKELMKYNHGQVGSIHYAEQLGELSDSNPPEWTDRADNEIEQGALSEH